MFVILVESLYFPTTQWRRRGSIEEGEEESDRHSVCSSFGGSAVRMFFVLTMLVSILPLVEW